MTVDEQFNKLNEKLQLLLKQHHRLQKENQRLSEELAKANDSAATASQRIDELQLQVGILKYAAGDLNEKDKKAFERKISSYIKEIDRCINFLGQ